MMRSTSVAPVRNCRVFALMQNTRLIVPSSSRFAIFPRTESLLLLKKMVPGVGHLTIHLTLHVGHLNRFWGPGVGNLTAENQKNQMPGGMPGGGMLRFEIDRYIRYLISDEKLWPASD